MTVQAIDNLPWNNKSSVFKPLTITMVKQVLSVEAIDTLPW